MAEHIEYSVEQGHTAQSHTMEDYAAGWLSEGFLWQEDLEAELDEARQRDQREYEQFQQAGHSNHTSQLRDDQLEYLSLIAEHLQDAVGGGLVQLGRRAMGHALAVRRGYARIRGGLPLLTDTGAGELAAAADWASAVEALAVAAGSMEHLGDEIAVDRQALSCSARTPLPAEQPTEQPEPGPTVAGHAVFQGPAGGHDAKPWPTVMSNRQPVVGEPEAPTGAGIDGDDVARGSEPQDPTGEAGDADAVGHQDTAQDEPAGELVSQEAEQAFAPEPEAEPAEPEPGRPVPSAAQLALAGQVKAQMRARGPVSSIAEGLMLREQDAELEQVAEHCRVSTSTVRRWYATADEILVARAAEQVAGHSADPSAERGDEVLEAERSEPEESASMELISEEPVEAQTLAHELGTEGVPEAAEDTEPEDEALEPTEAEASELESMEAELSDIFGDDEAGGQVGRSSFWDGFDG